MKILLDQKESMDMIDLISQFKNIDNTSDTIKFILSGNFKPLISINMDNKINTTITIGNDFSHAIMRELYSHSEELKYALSTLVSIGKSLHINGKDIIMKEIQKYEDELNKENEPKEASEVIPKTDNKKKGKKITKIITKEEIAETIDTPVMKVKSWEPSILEPINEEEEEICEPNMTNVLDGFVSSERVVPRSALITNDEDYD